jgi:hypothetical protein
MSDTPNEIRKVLTKKGYKFLGQGVDQSAYLEPGTDKVLKIFGTQFSSKSEKGKVKHTNDHKMFFTWAKFCMANADNPFLPKFDGFESFIFDNQTFLQIRQERLTKSGKVGKTIEIIGDVLPSAIRFKEFVKAVKSNDKGKFWHFSNSEMRDIQELFSSLGDEETLLLLKTINALQTIGNRKWYSWDLHNGNVMMRGKTPVIIDPWVI